MFSYYGGKGQISSWYPPPKYDFVIEPFAGAAWYSVRHQLGKRALVNDVNPIIFQIWDWLLHRATLEMVLAFPPYVAKSGMVRFSDPGQDAFYRFWGNEGTESPRNVAGSLHKKTWNSTLRTLPLIKGWECSCVSYEKLPIIEATWFVDPPYSQQSRYKNCSPLDYAALGDWCRGLPGQVIVCESEGATWLPFQPLRLGRGQRKSSKLRAEVYWIK